MRSRTRLIVLFGQRVPVRRHRVGDDLHVLRAGRVVGVQRARVCASEPSTYANVSQPFMKTIWYLPATELAHARERADVLTEAGVAVVDDDVGVARRALVAALERRLPPSRTLSTRKRVTFTFLPSASVLSNVTSGVRDARASGVFAGVTVAFGELAAHRAHEANSLAADAGVGGRRRAVLVLAEDGDDVEDVVLPDLVVLGVLVRRVLGAHARRSRSP